MYAYKDKSSTMGVGILNAGEIIVFPGLLVNMV